MHNKFTELRDGFLEKNLLGLKKRDLERLSAVINHVVSYPYLINEIIESGESKNIEKDKKIVQLGIDFINEINKNKKLVNKLIDINKSEKPGKPIKTEEYVNIYKKIIEEK